MGYSLNELAGLMAADPVEQDKLFLKVTLRNSIILRIRDNKWTQTEAAKVLGVTQPRVSALNQAKLEQFSLDMLIEMLLKTGSRLQTDSRESEDATAFLAMTFNKAAI